MKAHDSLVDFAEYLQLPLQVGESIIMMQECNASCAIYIGKVSGKQSALMFRGTIAASVAKEILHCTRLGRNRIEIADQVFRFLRRATYFEDRGAVVFDPV